MCVDQNILLMGKLQGSDEGFYLSISDFSRKGSFVNERCLLDRRRRLCNVSLYVLLHPSV